MKRVLRRVGSVKRLFFGAFALVAVFYVAQTLIFTRRNDNDDSNSSAAKESSSWTKNEEKSTDNNNNNNTIGVGGGSKTKISAENGVKIVVSDDGADEKIDTNNNRAGLCGVDSICPSSTSLVFSIRALVKTGGGGGDGLQKKPQFCINGKIISSAPTAPKTISVVVVVSGSKPPQSSSVEAIKHFDVSVDDKELRDYLIHLSQGSIIFLSSAGNVKERLTEDTRSVLRTHFGARNDTGISAASFVFVGQKGLAAGKALEKKKDDNKITTTTTTTEVDLRGCLQIPMGELEKPPAPVVMGGAAVAAEPSPRPGAAAAAGGKSAGAGASAAAGQVARRHSIAYGQEVSNCGLEKPCPSKGDMPVSVYSGKNKDDEPKICVNGRLVMSRSLNKGGRGLNAVILNTTTKEILRVGHFDTYAEDSSSLEVFLEELATGETIVVVSFDEASTHFSTVAKELFYELGSALVQNLKFRASWFLVGQKGISGFSPFEELNFASGNDWAKAIDRSFCLPPSLDGLQIRPDPSVQQRNVAKRHFCEKFDGYEEFCEDAHLDDQIMAAPLVNRSLNGNAIFRIPIMVVSGLSHNSLRLCLETLIRQQGIDPRFVLVTYDENYPESGELAQLFHVRHKPVTASASYITQVAKSFEVLWKQFPEAEEAIVIEEELLLTADFLYYMAQMLPILRSDRKVLAISAWNINGYTESATLPNLVYRVEHDFPGLAFMIRKETYTKYMQGKMDVCCGKRAWDGWNLDLSEAEGDQQQQQNEQKQQQQSPGPRQITIVPDLSRVMRRHVDGLRGIIDQTLEDIFHRERAYSKSSDAWITNTKFVSTEKAYDAHLRALIDSSSPPLLLADTILKECRDGKFSKFPPFADSRKNAPVFVLQYDQKIVLPPNNHHIDTNSDQSSSIADAEQRFLLNFRCCFGLYYSTSKKITKKTMKEDEDVRMDKNPSAAAADENGFGWMYRGGYKGVLRFSYNSYQLLLVGSRSPFYRHQTITTSSQKQQQQQQQGTRAGNNSRVRSPSQPAGAASHQNHHPAVVR